MSLEHDPVEDTDLYKRIVKAVDRLAELKAIEDTGARPGIIGFCHAHWAAKKVILRDCFGLAWKTPAEMNPLVLFD